METKPPLPPFNEETAAQKVSMAEDAWDSRDRDRVVQVYTEDSIWRNRAEFPYGRVQVLALFATQMGQGTGLPADQGIMNVYRQPYRRAFRLRMA